MKQSNIFCTLKQNRINEDFYARNIYFVISYRQNQFRVSNHLGLQNFFLHKRYFLKISKSIYVQQALSARSCQSRAPNCALLYGHYFIVYLKYLTRLKMLVRPKLPRLFSKSVIYKGKIFLGNILWTEFDAGTKIGGAFMWVQTHVFKGAIKKRST
jgi:hypothetical protein